MNQTKKAWRCNVCGYVHQGETPPEYCPVCGASAAEFALYPEPARPAVQPPANQWRCIICTYLHDGASAPDICPLCGAEQFEPLRTEAAAIPASHMAARILIIGGGIAGVSAAEAIRKASDQAAITLISSEPDLPYYRLNLTRYLAGEIGADELTIHPAEWYCSNRIELLAGQRVDALSPGDRTVTLADGRTLPYDRLILTAGAHPFIPPLAGSALDGVHTLRTAADADRIIAEFTQGEHCVCIGGGILGLETAGALVRRGGEVTLLESHAWLMPRQLNEPAARRLEGHLTKLAIQLKKSAPSAALLGNAGRVTGVQLESGEIIPCGMVILCTGVRPNTVLARKAGLEVNCGVVVDNHLRTSDPAIFAAGDIAEHNGILYGIWGPAQFQGTIAGLNALEAATVFGGLPRSNTLKVLGIEMLSIGEFTPPDGSYRVIQEQSESCFRHFVFHDGKMTGAILLGTTAPAAGIKRAIEEKKDLSGVLARSPDCSAILAAL